MAIYSCNLRSIGRTTHAGGTAGAHLRYIGREGADAHILAEHIPADPQDARTWMDRHERDARKNARLCDKIRIALPRELDEAQRAALVRDFMGGLSAGRIPWYAAIHQSGKDAHNPHVHIVVVDRDIGSGKRVLGLSDSIRDRQKKGLPGPSAVEWVRAQWEHHANQALERAGHDARIDRRTLQAQGIDREAQIHVGPRAQHVDSQVRRPESKRVPDPTPRHPERVIDYPKIDAGRTRRERNGEIVDLNLERAARSPQFETRVWAQFERAQREKDRPVESRLMAGARRRTLEERRTRRRFADQLRDIRARRDADSRFTRAWLRQHHAPDMQALKTRHAAERADLTRLQNRPFARFFAAVDVTGRTRRRRDAARMALSARHKAERQALAGQVRQDRAAQGRAVDARARPELDAAKRDRAQALDRLRQRHETERTEEDALLQARAAERERDGEAVQRQIEAWKRMNPPQAEERPERSKAGQDWDEKDAPALTPEERAEAARRRMEEGQNRQKQGRDRRPTRDRE